MRSLRLLDVAGSLVLTMVPPCSGAMPGVNHHASGATRARRCGGFPIRCSTVLAAVSEPPRTCILRAPQVPYSGLVRESELWRRLTEVLGDGYVRSWAGSQAIPELGSRTVLEALEQGESPKTIWRACWTLLELPDSLR